MPGSCWLPRRDRILSAPCAASVQADVARLEAEKGRLAAAASDAAAARDAAERSAAELREAVGSFGSSPSFLSCMTSSVRAVKLSTECDGAGSPQLSHPAQASVPLTHDTAASLHISNVKTHPLPCWADAGRAQLEAAEERAHCAESRGRRDSARAAVFVVALQRLRALVAQHEVPGPALCEPRICNTACTHDV